MKRKFVFFFFFQLFAVIAHGQIIDFPDANLRWLLLNSQLAQVASVTMPNFNWEVNSYVTIDANHDNQIEVSEAEQIQYLNISAWETHTIADFTGLEYFQNLKALCCRDNHLPSLDLSIFPGLEMLNCRNNDISVLDLSVVPNLKYLNCSANKSMPGDGSFTLNLSGLNQLNYLDCSWNAGLQSIDLAGLINLEYFDCSNTSIHELDFNGFQNLRSLNCGNCFYLEPTLLNTVTPNLTSLICDANQWATIDLSGLPNLVYLACSNNQLTYLDLTGLDHLIELNCDYNQLSLLDLTSTPNLQIVNCSRNQLTSLDLNDLTSLSGLNCSGNLISSMSLTGLPNLSTLECSINQLSQLDLEELSSLTTLYCYHNQLQSIYLKNESDETFMNFSDNPDLTLICQDADRLAFTQDLAVYYGYTNLTVSECNLNQQMFELENKLIISPNPTHDVLEIRMNGKIQLQSWSIYNALGQLVMVDDSAQKSIDVSTVPIGTYLIKIISDAGITSRTFIKQ